MISNSTLEALKGDVVIEPLKSELAKNLISVCPKFTEKGYKVMPIPSRFYDDIYRKTIKSYYLSGNHVNEHVRYDAISNERKIEPEVCYLDDDFFSRVHKDPEFVKLHTDFAGIDLSPTYWYGPRVYHKGDVLREHIDHPTTHVIGSSLNIFCEGDSNWPLVFKVGEKYEEVILKQGEMVIFEAVRIPHSRPVKFRGDRYFGIFYHFKPKFPEKDLSPEYLEMAEKYEKVM